MLLSLPQPLALSRVLPRPGPLWGVYPLRSVDDTAPPWRGVWAWRGAQERAARTAQAAQAAALRWAGIGDAARPAALATLRRRLRREGLTASTVADALGAVIDRAGATLGQVPRPTQCMAAAALLDQHSAEMATGEGKTLALALAAAVAALAGMPVHLVTANVYLATRDATALAPLYTALGLRVAALPSMGDDDARRAAYAHDVLYATARELAFDFLRDRLAQRLEARASVGSVSRGAGGAVSSAARPPRLRGLCMALLDEADSLLLDEAEVPLVLSHSAPHAARRAFLWQALALARQLEAGRDFVLHPAERQASLTDEGEARVAALATGLGRPWQRPRYRREAIVIALVGLHACRRDLHYVVRDGQVELLDEVTGRVAEGRVWSRGLHSVVALKEGLHAPAELDTVAQITFQRFFQRYWRVSGLSGTLHEARAELHAVLGSGVVRIPLHAACRLRMGPTQAFDNADTRRDAVCARVAALQAEGRPVLVGTDSVADSLAMSQHLSARGIAHRVLNALQDADEAAIVAAAGHSGAVTVATRMAGRGTDIELDDAARAAGGLHVLSCQHNPSQRLDRQLAGRAARHGDPGSSEAWLLRDALASENRLDVDSSPSWTSPIFATPQALTALRWRLWQNREERRRRALRRDLLAQGQQWDRDLPFAGPAG